MELMEQSDLDLLQTVPTYHLQSLLKARHVPVSSTPLNSESSPGSLSTPAPLPEDITDVARALYDPAALSEVIRDLGRIETLILQELVACGGRANSRDLALYLTNGGFLASARKEESFPYEPPGFSFDLARGYQQSTGPQNPSAHPHGTFELALRQLLLLGLLFWGRQTSFSGRDYSSGIHDGVLIVPQVVRTVARETWQAEQVDTTASDGEAESISEGARSLQRTLYLYWSLVAATREGFSLVSAGLLARSSLRHLVEQMGSRMHIEQTRTESDVPYLLFIRLLMMKLGLLQERNGTLHAAPSEAFFALPLAERVRRCSRLYLETPFWNELLYLPDVNVRPGPAPLEPAHEEIVHARQQVIERLLQERKGEWLDFPTFIARSKLHVPYLLFPRQYGPRTERYSSSSNPYGWDFRLRRGWLTHREGWHLVEGGFIRAIVSGPLRWLGLVELDREELANKFRLLPDIALATSETPVENGETIRGRLIVQPNFELVALAPVSELLLVRLDRFAERVSMEHIAQYRLTKASVTRAIQMGLRAETIQEELERAASGDLPQNVRYSLVEWERQARRVELWQSATLIEVDDAALLDALFADDETRALFGRRLSLTLAEVAPHQLAAVQELLWQRNYLPSLNTAPEQDVLSENGPLIEREAQWRLHDDGLLQPFYAVLDLYLAAAAERFSERDEPTGWYRITPTSLRRALEQNIELEHIIRFLQKYCEGGIPPSLLIRLKLWGGGYGEQAGIQVEPAPLLRLSAQVLRDLEADEELRPLLGTEVESYSRLVRVQADALERVMELLRERGFQVD